jgi:multicomponent K+:H+ antiporter subunit D
MAFVCCALLVAGLPPLSGFVAKFTMLSAAVQASTFDAVPSVTAWSLVACVLVSGLAGIVALTRIGMRLFWGEDIRAPRLHPSEAAPVGVLLLLCLALTFWAGPVMAFLEDTAKLLDNPHIYIDAVSGAHSGRES